MRLTRFWIYPAMGGAILLPAAPASAQSLGEVVGTATPPVARAVEQVGQAAEPVVQAVARAAQPVAKAAQPFADAARPVVEAAEPVAQAARPVTDTVTSAVSGATGGQAPEGGSGSSAGSSSGGNSGSGGSGSGGEAVESGSGGGAASAAPGSKTRYVVVDGKRCRPGEKKRAGAAGANRAGGTRGPGGGSSPALAAAAAERSLHVVLAERQAQERVVKDRADGGVLGASGEDEGGVLSIPGIGDSEEFSFGTGMAVLALFVLGFVGVVAGATSHVIGRMRSG